MSKQLKAAGITCGIGSMLVGARQAGFGIQFNCDWRKYYFKRDEEGHNTFEENFPGVPFYLVGRNEGYSEVIKPYRKRIDLALGHPECGNFSQLNQVNRERVSDPTDIPLFVKTIAELRPRFFVMDDLPKSLIAFPMEKYAEILEEYDLFPEWVSNYNYGNIQKNRKRMFMLGSLKKERWAFIPGEKENLLTVEDVIGDIVRKYGSLPNHDKHVLKELAAKGQHLLKRGDRATWRELRDYFKNEGGGRVLPYHAEDGTIKTRPGTYKGHWKKHAHVMDGGSPAIHNKTNLPYSIRERARIQGFPDDFIFYGTKLDRRGRWNHDKNIDLVKQTGKAMPIQFNRYVARQIASYIQKKTFEASGKRMLPPDPHIDNAKKWYCENVGYRSQKKACRNCWMYKTCELRRKK